MTIYITFGDDDQNKHFSSVRLAITSGMFIIYLVHFVIVGLAFLPPENRFGVCHDTIEQLMKKIYLFGAGCLISMNYLQGYSWSAIACWFCIVILFVMHLHAFPGRFSKLREQKVRNILWSIYYSIIFFWYAGVIGYFYTINSSKKN